MTALHTQEIIKVVKFLKLCMVNVNFILQYKCRGDWNAITCGNAIFFVVHFEISDGLYKFITFMYAVSQWKYGDYLRYIFDAITEGIRL